MNASRLDEAAGEERPVDGAAGGLGPLFDRRLRIEDLAEMLGVMRGDFERGNVATPRDVADFILLPVLRRLGWDTGDSSVVASSFDTGAGTVDFALCHPPGHPIVLVSIGALPGSAGASRDHPFDDCSIEALQVAVSEDGRGWRLHFPAGRGRIPNREFARFDIVGDGCEDIAEVLDAYLSFHAVKSREAFDEAERDYGEKRFPAEAHAAWRRSLAGGEVLHRFLREMQEAMGVPADRRRAERFVGGQLASVRWPADPPDPKPARRVGLGDRVFVYNFESREIETRVVVGREPNWDNGEVSRDSPIGRALFGAREGETREIGLPDREPATVRIVLIRDGRK